METLTRRQTRGRLYLIVIILLFAIPLGAAWWMVGRWHPGGSVHHGELLDPVHPISLVDVQTSSGESLADDFLLGRWTLIYLLPDDCDERCLNSLYDVRQIRLALGKKIDRTQSLFLFNSAPDETLRTLLKDQHAISTIAISATEQTALTTPFKSSNPAIYLLDPLSNLVLRYGPDSTSKGILEDLKRLLKYSKIG